MSHSHTLCPVPCGYPSLAEVTIAARADGADHVIVTGTWGAFTRSLRLNCHDAASVAGVLWLAHCDARGSIPANPPAAPPPPEAA